MVVVVFSGLVHSVPVLAVSPKVNDGKLALEVVAGGFKFPTSLVFLGEHDFIVGERTTGKIYRVIDGHVMPVPLLDANVSNSNDPPSGLFGMAATTLKNGTTYVYLAMLESGVRVPITMTLRIKSSLQVIDYIDMNYKIPNL